MRSCQSNAAVAVDQVNVSSESLCHAPAMGSVARQGKACGMNANAAT